MEDNRKNVRIAGAGDIAGGEYAEIKVSGSGKFTGDIVCEALRVAGSVTFERNAAVAGECAISGSAHFAGDVATGSIACSGSAHIDGDATSEGEAKFSGSGRVGGRLKAQSVVASGSLNVGGGVECESFKAGGGFTIGGLINAETVEITLGGKCVADEIGGGTVTVRRHTAADSSISLFGISINLGALLPPKGQLEVNTVEAGAISLEYTTAVTVRGETVELGEGCEVQRVEYSGTLIVADGATVGERVKV